MVPSEIDIYFQTNTITKKEERLSQRNITSTSFSYSFDRKWRRAPGSCSFRHAFYSRACTFHLKDCQESMVYYTANIHKCGLGSNLGIPRHCLVLSRTLSLPSFLLLLPQWREILGILCWHVALHWVRSILIRTHPFPSCSSSWTSWIFFQLKQKIWN